MGCSVLNEFLECGYKDCCMAEFLYEAEGECLKAKASRFYMCASVNTNMNGSIQRSRKFLYS